MKETMIKSNDCKEELLPLIQERFLYMLDDAYKHRDQYQRFHDLD